jgi:GNAT superfamily N-acetyltransferase
MGLMTVRSVAKAGLADWEVVKETRLRALADAPGAFASTLARELELSDAEWKRRVVHGAWFIARYGARPIGIAAGFAEDGTPDERHLVAMWVEAEQRGTTTATSLVESVCHWAVDAGAVSLALWVADGNSRARRFYDRLGFCSTGERQPLPSAPDVDEEKMVRRLVDSAHS